MEGAHNISEAVETGFRDAEAMTAIALLFGLIYFLFSAVSLVLHFVVDYTLTHSSRFRKHVALRMVIFLSVSDALQLLIHMFSGFLVIFQLQIDHTLNLVIGFIAMTLWNATIFQQVLLAINRFYVLSRQNLVITRPLHINLLIASSWLGALLLHVGYFLNGERFWFAIEVINWLETEPHTAGFLVLRYLKISLLVIGLVVGLGMLVIVLYQNYTSRPDRPKNRGQSAMEVRLFIQTCCSPALGLFNVVIWACCNISVNESGALVSGLLNLEWILINAMQPYLSLIFSRKVRHAVMEQVRLRRKALLTSTAIPKWSRIRQIRGFATKKIRPDDLAALPNSKTRVEEPAKRVSGDGGGGGEKASIGEEIETKSVDANKIERPSDRWRFMMAATRWQNRGSSRVADDGRIKEEEEER